MSAIHSRRQIVKILGSTQTHSSQGVNRARRAVDKIFSDLAPRFQTRPGGYTRIVRLALPRVGDKSEMCLIQYLPSPQSPKAKGGKDKDERKSAES